MLTTLATFDTNNGSQPWAGLTDSENGFLYGTSYAGGSNGDGTVFRVPIAGGAVFTVATFTGTGNGANPRGVLRSDGAGNLIGTTYTGGANNDGTVFRVPMAGGAVSTLVTFDGTNGNGPCPGLTRAADGNYYGATAFGGVKGFGTLFSLNAVDGTFTTLTGFTNDATANGAFPVGGVAVDSTGRLYGTTEGGGSASGYGSAFRVPVSGSPLTTLAAFNGVNGAYPVADLTADTAGNCFGTTAGAGQANKGSIFELPANGGAMITIATFDGADGDAPYASVLIDAAGNLFGVTSAGGAQGDGVVYRIDAGTNTITTLATFTGDNGANPDHAGLIADAAGNLYGTTRYGGTSNVGTVFELSNAGFVTAVPEPATAMLLFAIAASPLLGRSRRRR